uniref:Uncharacterized protein 22 n=1 Tax=Halisarca dujardinii TaxID=2583056 RepID=A0AA96MN30_HALDU|nr:uncharacterized protein 22 [Halisarca dujardinii]
MNTSAGNLNLQAPFASVLGVQGYTAIVSVLLAVLVPLQVFLSVLTIMGLSVGRTFRKVKAQRNVLIAIASMGFVSSAILISFGIAEYLFLSGYVQAGIVFCHGGTLFYHIYAGMSNYLLACLSVTVLIIIRYGKHKIRRLYLNIALVVMSAIVFVLGFLHFFPSAISFAFQFDGVICFPNPSEAGYAGTGLALALVDIPSRVVSIGVAIASLCIVKKYTNLENKQLKIALLKFTVLLVVLNIAAFLANYISLIPFLLLFSFKDHLDFASLAVFRQLADFLLPSIPSILTPLMMIAVFRPLRAAIRKLILPSGWRAHSGGEEEEAAGERVPGDKKCENVSGEDQTESTALDYRGLQH